MVPPPSSIVGGIERLAPGFWAAWGRAVAYAWQRSDGRMQVTSWYRTPSENQRVGGAPRSQHLVGVAFDVVPVVARNAEALRAAGFQVINEGDHLHAQPWPAGAVSADLLRYLGIA